MRFFCATSGSRCGQMEVSPHVAADQTRKFSNTTLLIYKAIEEPIRDNVTIAGTNIEHWWVLMRVISDLIDTNNKTNRINFWWKILWGEKNL